MSFSWTIFSTNPDVCVMWSHLHSQHDVQAVEETGVEDTLALISLGRIKVPAAIRKYNKLIITKYTKSIHFFCLFYNSQNVSYLGESHGCMRYTIKVSRKVTTVGHLFFPTQGDTCIENQGHVHLNRAKMIRLLLSLAKIGGSLIFSEEDRQKHQHG